MTMPRKTRVDAAVTPCVMLTRDGQTCDPYAGYLAPESIPERATPPIPYGRNHPSSEAWFDPATGTVNR